MRLRAFTTACALLLTACFPEVVTGAVADQSYRAQQLACIDQYADKPSIDKCRDRVKAAWATDAGVDAAKDGAP